MKRRLGFVLLACLVASGQSGIFAPRLGFIRDSNDHLRPVFGLAGNFVLGDGMETNAQRVAFSGRSGVLKTEDSLAVFDTQGSVLCQWDVQGRAAAVGISPDGSEAVALLENSSDLIHVRDCQAAVISLDPFPGEVLSAAIFGRDRLGLVVKREELLWLLEVSLPNGHVEQQTPLVESPGPVLLQPDGIVIFAKADELVVRKVDGTERRVPSGSPVARIESMGDGWVHIVEAGEAHRDLRMLDDREELYRLPEVIR
jgi:hypothetical protein